MSCFTVFGAAVMGFGVCGSPVGGPGWTSVPSFNGPSIPSWLSQAPVAQPAPMPPPPPPPASLPFTGEAHFSAPVSGTATVDYNYPGHSSTGNVFGASGYVDLRAELHSAERIGLFSGWLRDVEYGGHGEIEWTKNGLGAIRGDFTDDGEWEYTQGVTSIPYLSQYKIDNGYHVSDSTGTWDVELSEDGSMLTGELDIEINEYIGQPDYMQDTRLQLSFNAGRAAPLPFTGDATFKGTAAGHVNIDYPGDTPDRWNIVGKARIDATINGATRTGTFEGALTDVGPDEGGERFGWASIGLGSIRGTFDSNGDWAFTPGVTGDVVMTPFKLGEGYNLRDSAGTWSIDLDSKGNVVSAAGAVDVQINEYWFDPNHPIQNKLSLQYSADKQ